MCSSCLLCLTGLSLREALWDYSNDERTKGIEMYYKHRRINIVFGTRMGGVGCRTLGQPFYVVNISHTHPHTRHAAYVHALAHRSGVGCTVMEMLTAEAPFMHVTRSQLQVMHYICDDSAAITVPDSVSAESQEFLLCMLKR